MPRKVDPGLFGLHHATRLEQTGEKQFVIIINRKSRIIMQDGRKILAKAARITTTIPGATVSLRTSAPVCGKTRTLLEENRDTLDRISEALLERETLENSELKLLVVCG